MNICKIDLNSNILPTGILLKFFKHESIPHWDRPTILTLFKHIAMEWQF